MNATLHTRTPERVRFGQISLLLAHKAVEHPELLKQFGNTPPNLPALMGRKAKPPPKKERQLNLF